MAVPAKAKILPEKGESLTCLFNPAELTVMKSTKWTPDKSTGVNAPSLEFINGVSAQLSMKLFFDTTRTDQPVTNETEKLLRFMEINKQLQGTNEKSGKVRPPWVVFEWGSWKSQKMVIDKVTLKFTYFEADGTPLRATADIKLKQFKDESEQPPQNPTSHTPYPARIHHVTAGETLDRIAWEYFGDATKWLLIANANGIPNPLSLSPGTVLVIPNNRAVRGG